MKEKMKNFFIIEKDMDIYQRLIGLHIDMTRKYVHHEIL
jgi:hypothetical protein